MCKEEDPASLKEESRKVQTVLYCCIFHLSPDMPVFLGLDIVYSLTQATNFYVKDFT